MIRLHRALPLAATAVWSGASCSDTAPPTTVIPVPPPADSRLVLTTDPSGDTVAQRGIVVTAAFRDRADIAAVRLYVDSAARPVADQTITHSPYEYVATQTVLALAPGPGRHVVTVVATDTSGRTVSASLTRVFGVPTVRYAAAVLPDLGADAHALFVHANGDVVGWVATPAGRRRPALWRGGSLTVLPVPDADDVAAVRVNASGDVLLQFPAARNGAPAWDAVRVLRTDGALLTVGPAVSPNAPTFACCLTAGDLTDRREALGAGPNDPFGVAVRYDVAAGALRSRPLAPYVLLNNAGQMAGTTAVSPPTNPSTFIVSTLPSYGAYPGGPVSGHPCNPAVSWQSFEAAVDLDDGGALLAAKECTTYAYLAAPGSAAATAWLDRYVGTSSAIHLSRQGGVVASLDSAGAVYLWNAATRQVTQVAAPLGQVRLDGLGAVNAGGQIVVHGVDASTGKGAAVLLTPAP